jgi:hypothetical protein
VAFLTLAHQVLFLAAFVIVKEKNDAHAMESEEVRTEVVMTEEVMRTEVVTTVMRTMAEVVVTTEEVKTQKIVVNNTQIQLTFAAAKPVHLKKLL